MDARQELLAYLGASIVTIVGLFVLQSWYASYLDVAVVHASRADVQLNEKVAAVRSAEAQKLTSGRKPIDDAKRLLAGGSRTSFAAIAPKASDDLTPMSGWINQPGFKPYEPRTPPAPAEPVATPEAVGAVEGAAPAQPAAPPQGGQTP